MRGFRGSRAAQNVMSFRHGRHSQSLPQQKGPSQQSTHPQSQQRSQDLPDWLKTPETRAQEAREAQQPKAQQSSQPPLAKVIPIRPNLHAPVQPQAQPKPQPKKAAPAATVAQPVVARSKAKPRVVVKAVKSSSSKPTKPAKAPAPKKKASPKRKAA
jgi:hypothetical protein